MKELNETELKDVNGGGFLLGLAVTAAACYGAGYLYGKWRSSKQDSESDNSSSDALEFPGDV
ncbi:MAG: class IIb bacteriocin, lactobin A/cerein 7B family [Idiomarina sp.]|nr:class IIb bacteriocin, lactobin A/cerein 7B family [Idiomarina sp.]